MTREMRISRKIGMTLALISFVLGFFPILRFEELGTQTVFELMKNDAFMNMPIPIGKIYVVICLLTILLSLLNFVLWYYKKKGVELSFVVINLIMLGLIVVFPMALMFGFGSPDSVFAGVNLSGLPWSGWLLLRLAVGALEIINKSSGEEFVKVFVK